MEARLLRRPATDLLSSSGRNQHLVCLNVSFRRHESTYRRTAKRTNIKPHESFLPSKTAQGDQIIFNPPASAPSVFHTPLKFLPKEDKRRSLLAASQSTFGSRLPPPVAPKVLTATRHHLTEGQVKEMRKLRLENPDKWTNRSLARKYSCSSFFVTMCLGELPESSEERARKDEVAAKLEATKQRWGPRRRMAREDREKRVELALRDA